MDRPTLTGPDPLDVFAALPPGQRVIFLHSGRTDARWARRSILAFVQEDLRIEAVEDAGSGRTLARWPATGGAAPLKPMHGGALMRQLRMHCQQNPDMLWAGYFSYDLNNVFENIRQRHRDERPWPLVHLAGCARWLTFDHVTGHWSAHGHWPDRDEPARLLRAVAPPIGPLHSGALTRCWTPDAYQAAVRRVLGYIRAGDVFQVNLAQRMSVDFQGCPRDLYRRLMHSSPAWYGGFLDLGPDGDDPARTRRLLSISPELFLELGSDGKVITRPIKGTLPAGVPSEGLIHSAKERAELNMIVDLMRNDLGRVCRFGTIHVDEARAIEQHPTIQHAVATVRGQLHERFDLWDLLRATLPGGSVTGAPKIRAMQIIDELEPVARGPYCGSIGWIHGREACFNIAIRTLCIKSNDDRHHADLSVGGAIVADSDPAAEHAETLVKARALLEALQVGDAPDVTIWP